LILLNTPEFYRNKMKITLMKKQFYKARVVLSFLFLSFSAISFSQTASEIASTWYEWPHEAFSGNKVFKATPYVPVPGIDRQYDQYVKLQLSNNGAIIVGQYCGYCPNVVLIENTGTYSTVLNNTIVTNINVTFPNPNLNFVIDVISYQNGNLVLKY
jgi:hypothetical protein